MTNDLVALMKEFNVEVRMLGASDGPDPSSLVFADMLMEIHRLRGIEVGRAILEIPEWVVRGSFDHDPDQWEVTVYGDWDDDLVEFGRSQIGCGPDLMSAIRDAVEGDDTP